MKIYRYKRKVRCRYPMKNPVFDFSEGDILEIVQKILDAFKKVMAWLGILVLPEEGEYDYPTTENTEGEN